MTKEDVIKLAIDHTIHGLKFDEDGLLRFAKLVAQHEREACATLCDVQALTMAESAKVCAEAIRARGQA
jgi:hypothetical protein